jgi:hypothetical protein
MAFPIFLAKSALIASHINISKFRELTQGFADTQILDLLQYGFPLDLDRHNFIPNCTATNFPLRSTTI